MELLRLRTDGRNPNELEEPLRAVIDVRDFYASDLYVPAGSASSVGAIAGAPLTNTLTLTDPLGLRSIGGTFTAGAAAPTNLTFSWGFFLVAGGGSISVPLGSYFVPAMAAAAIVNFGTGPYPYVLPAGTVLFAQVMGTGAGADHTLNVRGLLENLTFRV